MTNKWETSDRADEANPLLGATHKVTRLDTRRGRYYRVHGYPEPFVSVTTVLGVVNKPALVGWATRTALEDARMAMLDRYPVPAGADEYAAWVNRTVEYARTKPSRLAGEAADFGTQAHLLIDQLLQGRRPQVPAEFETVIASFDAWRQQAGLDIALTETMVYSPNYRYAGTMDALAFRGNQVICLDWKSSRGVYPEYALQVAAYAKAVEELTGKTVTEGWVVRLGKARPEFEARQVKDLDRAFAGFQAALGLWRAMNGDALL